MESFYGGRQGASIVIKARFKYITDQQKNNNNENSSYIDPYYDIALTALTTGESAISETDAKAILAPDTMTVQLNDPSYTNVWYNEYCIIDSDNKNNTNNGKIYRRTLKSVNDEDPVGSVAEYIGQIVGPAGSSPQLGDVVSVSALTQKFNTDKGNLNIDDVLTYIGEQRTIDGELVEKWTIAKGDGFDPPMKIRPLISGTNLIPGNTQTNGVYVQQGNYGWYNIRKNTSDTDTSLVYLGFDIPYYVTEFENGNVLSYAETATTVTKTINTGQTPTAPFYEKYQINVPRGVPGAWIDNLQWVTTSSANQYHSLSSLIYEAPSQANEWTDSWSIPNNTAKPSININTSVWICDFHWFNKDGQKRDIPNLYIGKYKAIKNITLDNDGTLTIEYTDNSSATSFGNNKITWITDALVVTGSENDTLDRYIGHLLVKFNNNDITPGSPVTNTTNYNSYRDLGLVKTIQEGLFVESKGYSLSVNANDDIATIETKIHNYLHGLSGNDAPDETKAQIVTITKGTETEKAVVYWNSKANSGNGKWELLGDTVSGGGGSARNGAVLEVPSGEGEGYEPGTTDLIFQTIEISSNTLTDYPPVFPA